MKRSLVPQTIAVIAVLALSATIAHAGGGPGATAFSAFFECQTISNGGNPREIVSIHDPNTDSVVLEPKAIVGIASLACRQVEVRDSTDTVLAPPTGDTLKCYVLAVHPPSPPQFFSFSDTFGTEDNVRVLSTKYLCGTTNVTQ